MTKALEHVTVKELIEQLQEYVEMGYEDARVCVRCESFGMVDLDADCELKWFDYVPSTGVEEGGSGTGISAYVVIGREDPEVVRDLMCEGGWWAKPNERDFTEAEAEEDDPTPTEEDA